VSKFASFVDSNQQFKIQSAALPDLQEGAITEDSHFHGGLSEYAVSNNPFRVSIDLA
jgi:hypothetical protein